MLEKLEECPVCSNNTFTTQLTCKDHFLSKEDFSIIKCSHCSFLFTNPRPKVNAIDAYYKSSEYISHTSKANNLLNTVYKSTRYFTLSRKVKLINKITSNKYILDFGCGTGDFLFRCKQKRWKIKGFEPEKLARDIASKKNNIPIYSSLDQLTKIKQIGLITLWHVLEHIHDLNNTIDILKSKLTEDGSLLIAVPNHESFDADYYKEYWAAYDVPRHLYHFSQSSMNLLLKNHGLKINEIIPMKLDSFYVSLLSEKYKNGKSNYIKSFINGYKSNVYAKKQNNNYSSLIYIVNK